jgi:hypothetical protein
MSGPRTKNFGCIWAFILLRRQSQGRIMEFPERRQWKTEIKHNEQSQYRNIARKTLPVKFILVISGIMKLVKMNFSWNDRHHDFRR